jgi:MFS-type transporter involved in bile tolerance (Atg22 family)
MMFDFANSGYTTVVITAVFSAYFVATVTGDAEWGTFAWTAALSVSYALILLSAPVLGAWADCAQASARCCGGPRDCACWAPRHWPGPAPVRWFWPWC